MTTRQVHTDQGDGQGVYPTPAELEADRVAQERALMQLRAQVCTLRRAK